MLVSDPAKTEELREIFLRMRETVGDAGSFRLRVLIEMLMIEVEKERATVQSKRETVEAPNTRIRSNSVTFP